MLGTASYFMVSVHVAVKVNMHTCTLALYITLNQVLLNYYLNSFYSLFLGQECTKFNNYASVLLLAPIT